MPAIAHRPPMPRQARAVALLSAAACLVSACTVGPDYKGPPNAAPLAQQSGRFQRAQAAPVATADPPAQWWLALNDDTLTRLITEALAANPNLQAAEARIRNARAMVMQQRAKLLPQGGATVAYVNAGLPASTGSLLGGGQSSSGSGASSSSSSSGNLSLYSVGFDATWELDIFGGVRRGVENARATAEAQVASFEDTQVQLASEVAQAYVNLRDAQTRARLGKADAELEDRMLRLTAERRAGGTASDADVERLRTQHSQTQANLTPLQAQVDQYLDQLAVLTGREPGALDADLASPAPAPLPPATVAIGDPAEMIRRRPDIRKAERQLAADNAAIGQNVASYFPTVNLFGDVGYAGSNTADLFSSKNLTTVGAPYISWNVLNLPSIGAKVRGAKATRDASLASYRDTVLTALQDAEDSLSRFGHQRQTVTQLAIAQDSAARAAALTRDRNAAGTASLIDTLDTERQRVEAEQSLVQARAQLTNDYIALQKSLGLGWQAAAPRRE